MTWVDSRQEGMLILPGGAWDAQLEMGGGTVQLLGNGVEEQIPYSRRDNAGTQALIDAVDAWGGLVFQCHPCWAMSRTGTITGIKGLHGAEISDSVFRLPDNIERAKNTCVQDLLA